MIGPWPRFRATLRDLEVSLRRSFLLVSLFGCVGAAFAACGTDGVDIPPAPSTAVDGSSTADGPDADDGATSQDAGPVDAAPADTGKPCPAPADPARASLCITLAPENIKFEAEPGLDGRGYMSVSLYATAFPEADGNNATPLATLTYDADPDGGTAVDLRAPPEIRFDSLDRVRVFARVVFLDGKVEGQPQAGWWLGGIDVSKGLKKDMPLAAIDLVKGAGTRRTIPMTALRRLAITVGRTVAPIGNAQGPLAITALKTDTIIGITDFFGTANKPCANLQSAGSTVLATGFVIGPGPYYLVPELDDFGGSTGLSAGSLTALDLTGGSPKIPATSKLTYANDAYIATHTLSLTTAIPRANGPADTTTCP